MRALKFSLILFVLLLILISCEKQISRLPETGESGGDIVVGIINEPANLSPFYPSFTARNEIADMLFLPLHKLNYKGEIIPVLAKSWEYSEDLSKITYYLNDNIYWQDGKKVTAYDVEFTFYKMKDPKNGYPLLSKLQYIDSVKVLDEYTIKFFFSKVYPRALYDSNIKALPKHILKDEQNFRFADFHSKPIGNGPYKLKEWKLGKYIELVKNENYSFEEKPFINRIIYKIYSTQQALIDDIKKGIVDVAYDLAPNNKATLEKLKNINVLNKKGNVYTYIGFNLKKKPFDKKELRLGLSYLIDRKGMIKNYTGNNAALSNGPLTPSFWAYSEKVSPISFDKKKAEEYLKKVISKKYGKYYFNNNRFSFTIITDKNDVELIKIANAIANQFSNNGIRVKVKALESADLIQRLIKGDFDVYVLSWKVDNNFNPYPFWSSDPKKGTFNFVNYRNEKIDKILEQAMSTMEKEKALQYWYEFQKTIMDDQPYAFLYIPNRIIAVNKVLESFADFYKTDADILSNLDIFYVKKNAQKNIDLASLFKVEKKQEKTTPTKKTTKKTTPTKKVKEKPKEKKPTASEILSEAAAKTTEKTEEKTEEKPKIIIQPQLKNLAQATYPEAAAKIGAEGMVFVEVLVGKDGNVKSAKILKGVNSALDEAAKKAALKCKFKPGTIDGVPAEMKATIPYRFIAP